MKCLNRDCENTVFLGGPMCRACGCCLCAGIILADTEDWPDKLCADHFETFARLFEDNRKWTPDAEIVLRKLFKIQQLSGMKPVWLDEAECLMKLFDEKSATSTYATRAEAENAVTRFVLGALNNARQK